MSISLVTVMLLLHLGVTEVEDENAYIPQGRHAASYWPTRE
ncbi:hypothetical protein [Nocardia sp. CY41]|nr:hypothetical protein [Nocardia sp. CY41]